MTPFGKAVERTGFRVRTGLGEWEDGSSEGSIGELTRCRPTVGAPDRRSRTGSGFVLYPEVPTSELELCPFQFTTVLFTKFFWDRVTPPSLALY